MPIELVRNFYIFRQLVCAITSIILLWFVLLSIRSIPHIDVNALNLLLKITRWLLIIATLYCHVTRRIIFPFSVVHALGPFILESNGYFGLQTDNAYYFLWYFGALDEFFDSMLLLSWKFGSLRFFRVCRILHGLKPLILCPVLVMNWHAVTLDEYACCCCHSMLLHRPLFWFIIILLLLNNIRDIFIPLHRRTWSSGWNCS